MRCLLIILTLLSFKSYAQTEEDRVKQPINNMFNAMRTSDTSLLKSAFAPGAILQTIVKTKDGNTLARTQPLDEFVNFLAKPHSEVYDERITFDMIRIDADLAIAWTPYQFYVGQNFSHCGVNSFQLIKINGDWKIQYIIDTRRRDNCK